MTRPVSSRPAEAQAPGGELVERRSRESRTFRQADGSLKTMVGGLGSALNVPGPGGVLIPVDTTLVPVARATRPGQVATGAALATAAAEAVLSVPATADGPVRVAAADGTWVQSRLLGAKGTPRAAGATATVAQALPGVTVGWTSTVGGLKETLTLASAKAQRSFEFAISTSPGLTLTETADGGLVARDSKGTAVWVLPAPFMDDAAGAHSDAVSYDLEPAAKGSAVLRLTADPAWLDAPGRAWPVVVDPTVLLSAGGSGATQDLACSLRSATPTVTGCAASTLTVGASSGAIDRAVLRFPQLNQVVPANAVLATAALTLPVTADTGGGAMGLEARPLTGGFTSAATWNTRDGSAGWTGGAGALGQTGAPVWPSTVALPSAAAGTRQVVPVTGLGQQWLSGQTGNFGVLLKSTAETTLRRLTVTGLTATCTSATACGTHLEVAYLERLGAYQGSQFFDSPLTDQSTLQINLANGNALLTATDHGFLRSLNSRRTDQTGQLGRAWTTDSGRDTIAYLHTDRTIRYYAPGHALYVFLPNADGTFRSPPGLAATATNLGAAGVRIRFERSGETLTFDGGQRLVSTADRNGNLTRYAYSTTTAGDGVRFSTTVTDPAGRIVTLANNGARLTGLTDALNRTYAYGYTSSAAGDLLTTVTDGPGNVTRYGYDSTGRLSRVTTAQGRVTRLLYDNHGRVVSLIRVSNPAGDGGQGSGPTTTFSYTPIAASATATPSLTPAARGTTVVTDPRGNRTTYLHDSLAQITRVTDALGRKRDTEYGPDGNVTTAYDAMGVGSGLGKATAYTYDSLFNPTGTTLPTGASSTSTYADPVQRYLPDRSTDAQANTIAFSYDARGNLTRTQDVTAGPTGGATTTRGVFGTTGVAACGGRTGQTGQVCTETDGNGNTTRFTYDGQGNLNTVTPPANSGTQLGVTRFTYDALGRVLTVVNGKGQTRRNLYDGQGRLIRVYLPGTNSCTATDLAAGNCIIFRYDADGNLDRRTEQAGVTTYAFDALGREVSRTLPGQAAQTLTYDAAGNLLTTSSAAGVTTHGYDAANQLTSLAEPGGTCGSSPVRCTRFGYDANGQRATTTYPTTPATVITTTFDDSSRPTRIRAVTGTSVVHTDLSYAYAYRPAGATADRDGGLVSSRTDNTATGTTGRTTTYGYDTLQRLTAAVERTTAGATTASWAYGYDNAGNRTSATIGTTSTAFGYNAANQLISRNGSTAGFAYDANGNETAAVGGTTRAAATWNNKDQLAGLAAGGTAVPFGYLGLGNQERISRAATSFTNTATGLATEITGSALSVFIRDPAGGLIALRTGAGSHYYLTDNLGSVIGLLNSAGSKVNSYSYDPYGISRAKTEQVANPFEYTGGYLDDATGLYKLGIRYYDPTLGRFTQPDPTGLSAGYTYAGNDPVNLVDRTGACENAGETRDNFYNVIRPDYCIVRPYLTIGPAPSLFGLDEACLAGAFIPTLPSRAAAVACYFLADLT